MMIKTGGELHYYINGLDQGIAATTVPSPVWAVVDLYGMTVKVGSVLRLCRRHCIQKAEIIFKYTLYS